MRMELSLGPEGVAVVDTPVCSVVAFILVTCSPSPASHSSSSWILQTALPTRYEANRKCSLQPGF